MQTVRRIAQLAGALALALLLIPFVAAQDAAAHERRDLLAGKYQVIVGFLNEPAYDTGMNGVDFRVVDKTQQNADGTDKGVEGLEKTLKVQVLADGQMMELPFRARFRMPGSYAAYFEPTRAGQYVFRVYGEIEGQAIDERFESGPGRFNDVESTQALQFPAQRPVVPADLQAQLDAAQAKAETAQILGIAGMALGLLGLGTAALTLLRRRPVAVTEPALPATAATTATAEGD